jgi:hypothetical protein
MLTVGGEKKMPLAARALVLVPIGVIARKRAGQRNVGGAGFPLLAASLLASQHGNEFAPGKVLSARGAVTTVDLARARFRRSQYRELELGTMPLVKRRPLEAVSVIASS